MEITFCDHCHESIPDADLAEGRSLRVRGKPFHLPCALSAVTPGRGKRTVAVLAVAALAFSVYSVARLAGGDGDARRARRDADERLESVRKETVGDVQKDLALLRTELRALEQAVTKQGGELAAAADFQEKARQRDAEATQQRFRGFESMLADFQSNIAEVRGFVKAVADLAARTPPTPIPAPSLGTTTPAVPTPQPVPEPPTAPSAGDPTPAPDPELAKRREKDLVRFLAMLKDPLDGVAFSATVELAKLKDLRAVQPLIDTLKSHKDFYTRMGAASALGDLRAADAVRPLIDALDDKDELVQTAASASLTSITGQDFKFVVGLSRKDRRRIREQWLEWWAGNEASVRRTLNQPATAR